MSHWILSIHVLGSILYTVTMTLLLPGVGEEPPGHGIRRELMRCGALEADHALCLGVTVGHVVRVVTDVFLRSVGQALVARGLVGHTMGTLTMVTVVTMVTTTYILAKITLKNVV